MISDDASASNSFRSGATEAGGGPWWHEAPAPEPGPGAGAPFDSTEALVGAAVEEFAKLAGSVAQWADRTGVNATVKSFAEQAASALGASATCDRRVCDVCPICQGMAALSAARPELAEGLIDVMTAVGELVHAVAETVAAGRTGAGHPSDS